MKRAFSIAAMLAVLGVLILIGLTLRNGGNSAADLDHPRGPGSGSAELNRASRDQAGPMGNPGEQAARVAAGPGNGAAESAVSVLDALTGRRIADAAWNYNPEEARWSVTALHYIPAVLEAGSASHSAPVLDQPVLLHPCGSVTLRVNGRSFEPDGVEVQLRAVELPVPRLELGGRDEPVSRVLRARCEADGRLHFPAVPVGRWVAQVPGYALLASDPAPDAGYQLEGNTLTVHSPPPPEATSGVFEISQGQDCLVKLDLGRGAIVRGELAGSGPVLGEGVQIELRSERAIRADGMPKMFGRVAEKIGSKTDFRFEALQPGQYHVNALVVTTDDVYTLYHQRFELRAGQELDLGSINPQPGEIVVRWETVDADSGLPNDSLRYWVESGCRIPTEVWASKPGVWSYGLTTAAAGTTRLRGLADSSGMHATGHPLEATALLLSPRRSRKAGSLKEDGSVPPTAQSARCSLQLPERMQVGSVQMARASGQSAGSAELTLRIPCSMPRECRIRVLHPGVSTGGTLNYTLYSKKGSNQHQARLKAGAEESEFVLDLPQGMWPHAYAAWIDGEAGLQAHGSWMAGESSLLWSLTPGLEIPIRRRSGKAFQPTDPPDALWIRIPGEEGSYGIGPRFKANGEVSFVGVPRGVLVALGMRNEEWQAAEHLLGGIMLD